MGMGSMGGIGENHNGTSEAVNSGNLPNQLNFNKADLIKLFSEEDFSPENLLGLLKKQFIGVYEQDSGVDEKYTLETHTLMVMRQFEKYFGHLPNLPGNVFKNLFRLFLGLHDVGKPEAISNGGKHLQHHYTEVYIRDFFSILEIDEKNTNLTIVLASQDVIGNFLVDKIAKDKAIDTIKEMALNVGLPDKVFFELLCIYFKVDAGSYTINAGGKKESPLDKVFVFDKQNMDIKFAPKIQAKINQLGF